MIRPDPARRASGTAGNRNQGRATGPRGGTRSTGRSSPDSNCRRGGGGGGADDDAGETQEDVGATGWDGTAESGKGGAGQLPLCDPALSLHPVRIRKVG